MMAAFPILLLGLLLVHVVCDVRPLQWRRLSAAKREHAGALALHAAIHGAGAAIAVAAFAGAGIAAAIGLAEAATHAAIDFGKCRGRYGIVADQAMHLGCQIVWAAIVVGMAHG